MTTIYKLATCKRHTIVISCQSVLNFTSSYVLIYLLVMDDHDVPHDKCIIVSNYIRN